MSRAATGKRMLAGRNNKMPNLSARDNNQGFLYTMVGVWIVRAVTLGVVLTAWELYGRTTSPGLFAPPSAVVEAAYDVALADTVLWTAASSSLIALIVGLSAAIVVGIGLGIVMGWYRVAEYVLDPYVSFMYALPMSAILPLLIIWFGIDVKVRILLVFLICVFPLIISTMAGVKAVRNELVDVARSSCASEIQILRTVIFPGSLPFIFSGLQVAIGLALSGTIVAEMIVALSGLGGLVVTYANTFEAAKVFVPLSLIVTMSLGMVALLRFVRKRVMPWDRSF